MAVCLEHEVRVTALGERLQRMLMACSLLCSKRPASRLLVYQIIQESASSRPKARCQANESKSRQLPASASAALLTSDQSMRSWVAIVVSPISVVCRPLSSGGTHP
jgi:hypothetical protein